MLQYAAFTQTEGMQEGGKWPTFRPAGTGGVFSGPSYLNLEAYCNYEFTEVRDHVQLGY